MDLRDGTQQVLDGEVWNNHLVLLNSRHAILFFKTHSDRGRRKRASGLCQHSAEEKKKCRNGRGGIPQERWSESCSRGRRFIGEKFANRIRPDYTWYVLIRLPDIQQIENNGGNFKSVSQSRPNYWKLLSVYDVYDIVSMTVIVIQANEHRDRRQVESLGQCQQCIFKTRQGPSEMKRACEKCTIF